MPGVRLDLKRLATLALLLSDELDFTRESRQRTTHRHKGLEQPMTYARVMIKGSLGPSEVWSVNPTFNISVQDDGWDQGKGNAAVAAIAAIAVPLQLQQLATTSGKVATLRLEYRTDSHVLLGAAEAAYTGGWTSNQTPSMPPQSSIVLSLRSDVPGARGRGRLYWPAVGGGIDTNTLRISSPTTAAIAGAATTYLRAIQDAIKTAIYPAPIPVTVRLTVVSKTSGTRTDINRVLVGNVIDTQRRRRDRMPEVYASANFPGA
uniref:Uncharacterized protein n=1 Tax=uncultured prokaryote TaxID=198431 RepID=A0A0H5QDD1_9ZZZZ|nr:hypothetical protein [uncultured prokaryote]